MAVTQKGLAQYNRPGSTSADFLRIGVSARAAGLGNAYISAVDGADATYYNPAALPIIQSKTSVFLNHTSWFAGINHEFVGFTQQTKYGSFGGSVTALYTDDMKVRTPQQPEGTGETFYSSSVRANLVYARSLTPSVTFGGSVSYINLNLYDNFRENAYAVDIAAMYRAPFRNFRFAMKIANLGSEVQFVNEQYPLPVHFTFGASIDAIETPMHTVMVTGSATKPNDGAPVGQAGIEYGFDNLLYLRGGYKFNYDVATFSAGMGLKMSLNDYQFSFNYGYSSFGLLGNAHRFSLELYL